MVTRSAPPPPLCSCSRYLRAAGELLLLAEVDRLALEHVEEGLRRFHNLGVRGLGLGDGLVVLGARRDLAREVVVDPRQPLRQDPKVVLDLGCERRERRRCVV